MLRPGRIRLAAAALVLMAAAAGADPGAHNTLAILNLRPTNFEAMGYNGEILYALISALEKEKSVELVPRRQMEDKLFQAGMVQGDTPEMAMAAARVLGIRYVLFGNVTKEGARIRANLSLLDAHRRKVAETWTESYGSRQDILSQIPAFAGSLVAAMWRQKTAPAAEPVKAPPKGPEATLEALKVTGEGDRIVVHWKARADGAIAGYHVYRAESPQGPYQFLGRMDEEQYADAAIRKGRTYYYRIGVLLASGQEVKSERTARIRNTGEKLPHPPLILSGAGFVRRTEIRYVANLLNEQENFSIAEYRIHRKSDPADPWTAVAAAEAKLSSQTELGFTFEDKKRLEDGGTYLYAVSSIDKKKRESPLSDPVAVTTVSRPVLRLEKDRLLREIELAWQPMDQVEGYYLYRKQAPGSWQRLDKIRAPADLPYTDDDGLEDGQQYEYRLTAYDAKGETGPSNEISARTKPLPPFPADIMAVSGMVESVQLVWTPVDDPDVGGYAIYRGTDPGRLEPLTKLEGCDKNTHLDKGTGFSSLDDGVDYYYAVASYNRFGAEGARTPAVRARTKPRPSPARGLRLSPLPDRILVQWDPNPEPDIAVYHLYRSRGGGWSKIEEAGPKRTSYSDTDLKPGAEYRYRIIVEDSAGLKSDPAESRSIASPAVENES